MSVWIWGFGCGVLEFSPDPRVPRPFGAQSGLGRDFRTEIAPMSVTFPVGAPICPYGIATVGPMYYPGIIHKTPLKSAVLFGFLRVSGQSRGVVPQSSKLGTQKTVKARF